MSRENLYHLLNFLPAIEAWEMPPALETMARQLVASGRLRINADHARNFVRLGTADSERHFSARELHDPVLLPRTRTELQRHVPPAAGPDGVEQLLERLRRELKTTGGISETKELRVARVLAQSAHPAVIALLLQEGTEVFVSYSHTVGDLMAVHFWESDGKAGGLQATSDNGTAVYVSCGGDPFFDSEHKTYETDGFPALARMVVIAGQELGHFADLIRTTRGIGGRYSLSPETLSARRADLVQVALLAQQLAQSGLAKLQRAEDTVRFYRKQRRFSPLRLWHEMKRLVLWLRFPRRLSLHTFPKHDRGQALGLFLHDMRFNLAPDAEAYRRADPAEEEAIACVEALARAPQQVNKWGHAAVQAAWPNLYRVYYGTVIPGVLAALPSAPPAIINNRLQQLIQRLRRRFRSRPGYWPEG